MPSFTRISLISINFRRTLLVGGKVFAAIYKASRSISKICSSLSYGLKLRSKATLKCKEVLFLKFNVIPKITKSYNILNINKMLILIYCALLDTAQYYRSVAKDFVHNFNAFKRNFSTSGKYQDFLIEKDTEILYGNGEDMSLINYYTR